MSWPTTNPHEPAIGLVENGKIYGGLTKREAIAMAALQGIRASMNAGRAEYAACAEMAVNQADALISMLNKWNYE